MTVRKKKNQHIILHACSRGWWALKMLLRRLLLNITRRRGAPSPPPPPPLRGAPRRRRRTCVWRRRYPPPCRWRASTPAHVSARRVARETAGNNCWSNTSGVATRAEKRRRRTCAPATRDVPPSNHIRSFNSLVQSHSFLKFARPITFVRFIRSST